MDILLNSYVIAGLLSIVTGLIAYCIITPRGIGGTYSPDMSDNGKFMQLLASLGNDFYAALPNSTQYHIDAMESSKIQTLLKNSGNPWRMSVSEFFFFQFITAFVGLVIGSVSSWLLASTIPWYITPVLFTVLGFYMPTMYYKDVIKRRDFEFKKELPEALDLIAISLSGGQTLVHSIREAIPNMKDGILKNEFQEVLNSIDTGQTLNHALENFSKRVPNDNIRTFIQAVKEASELNVPMLEVFESRSKASRQEYMSIIHKKTASLDSKMVFATFPTFIPGLLIVLLAPALVSIAQNF